MPKSGYDAVAMEYYDDGHVTSRNFDAATREALRALSVQVPSDGLVLELGAGRGRAQEYLDIASNRIVQLDSSSQMLAVQPREGSLLQIEADACKIPLPDEQFAVVVGFLIDPFLGLQCLRESRRMLRNGGLLLLTTPTYEWGAPLRESLQMDMMTTRFKLIRSSGEVRLPSVLRTPKRLREMLAQTGFENIEISAHSVPASTTPISPDIELVCTSRGLAMTALPVIHVIRGTRK